MTLKSRRLLGKDRAAFFKTCVSTSFDGALMNERNLPVKFRRNDNVAPYNVMRYINS